MKLTAMLLTIFSLTVTARSLSQSVTFKGADVELKTIFSSIERQTGYFILYESELLKHTKRVTIEAAAMPLSDFLYQIFKEQPLTYSIKNTSITIKPKYKTTDKQEPKISNSLFIPPITIRGRVVDERGEMLAGASILVTATGISTFSDGEGAFILYNVEKNAILEISYVGYTETRVKASEQMIITLRSIQAELNEIVFNKGYYSETQKLSTGSVAKITSKEIEKQPVNNVLGAMIGRMPGVQIQQENGLPGGGFNVQVRGLNSLRWQPNDRYNGNRPLYLIDGVPFNSYTLSFGTSMTNSGLSPFASLAPGDIESIEVLKDADATAIYGSRGANGVVLITTKKGKAGKTNVTVDFSQGVGHASNFLNLLSTEQYLEMRKEAYANEGIEPSGTIGRDLLLYDQDAYTDFQQLIFGKASSLTNARASISGGAGNTNFLLGVGYSKETAVLNDNSANQKFSTNFRINNTSDNKKLRVAFGGIMVVDVNNLGGLDLRGENSGIDLAPNSPNIYDEQGNLNFENGFKNPIARTFERLKSNTQNLNLNSSFEYDIIRGLTVKSVIGYGLMRVDNISTKPVISFNPATDPRGNAYFSNGKSNTWIAEPQIQYRNSFNAFSLDVLVGGTIQKNIFRKETLLGTGYSNDAFIENLIAAPFITPVSMDYTEFKYVKAHTRFNINYDQKYILNLTASRDGSSRFGPNKRFGNFGAAGFAWLFSEENFSQNNFPFLSLGKLRASFGVTGGDGIPDYGFLDTYTATTTLPYDGVNSLVPSRIFNGDFAWERNKKLELAVELGFLKDRINLFVNWYKNRSTNQLVGYPLSAVTGFATLPYYNLPATVQNTGVEVMVSGEVAKSVNFSWRSTINLTIPKNKLVEYPDLENSANRGDFVIGQPIFLYRFFKSTGVDPQTGIYQFEDVDKNGVIDDLDRQTIIDPNQKYYGGWQNNITYKNFEISLFVQFVKQLAYSPLNGYNAPGGPQTQLDIVMDRWQKPGDVAKYQKFAMEDPTAMMAHYNAQNSDLAIEDASFVRLKNVSISYRLPPEFLQRSGIKNASVFVQGQNIFTITNYNGLDPETKSYATIPTLRIIAAGFQLSF